MSYDVWFARHKGHLHVAVCEHDDAPMLGSRRVESVEQALSAIRRVKTIAQVGIVPPEMLGLE